MTTDDSTTDDNTTEPGGSRHGGLGSPVADRVHDLLAPVMASVGADLVDVHWAGGTLRIVADRPGDDPGQGGITTDGLAEINRLVSPILDQHDPVPGRYTLEVSSPGVERPLRRPDHFRRAVGETVIVKTVPGTEPRRIKGRLESIDGTRLTIEATETDGVDLSTPEVRQIDLVEIGSARTHFEWGPTPKLGSTGKKKSSGKRHSKQAGKGSGSKRQVQQKRSEDGR
jgi:ribosome maturation factor RimP